MSKILTFQIMTLKIYVKVTKNNIENNAISWRIYTYIRVIGCIFALVLTISEILTFQICDFKNLDEGHEVQHSVTPFDFEFKNL